MSKEIGILVGIMMIAGFILAFGTEFIVLGEIILVLVLGILAVCIVEEVMD